MRNPKLTAEVLAYGWGNVPDAGGQLSFASLVWRIPGAITRAPSLPGVVQGSSSTGSVQAHSDQLSLQLNSTRLTTAGKSQHTVRYTREHSTAEGGLVRVHLSTTWGTHRAPTINLHELWALKEMLSAGSVMTAKRNFSLFPANLLHDTKGEQRSFIFSTASSVKLLYWPVWSQMIHSHLSLFYSHHVLCLWEKVTGV